MGAKSKIPPVLREMVGNRINELLRIGEPFTIHDICTKDIIEMAGGLTDEEKYLPEHSPVDTITLVAHGFLKSKPFRERAFRRWNRATMRPETKHGSTVVYPSNVRERYHVKDNEVLLPWSMSKADAAPPLRVTVAEKVETQPTAAEAPVEPPKRGEYADVRYLRGLLKLNIAAAELALDSVRTTLSTLEQFIEVIEGIDTDG